MKQITCRLFMKAKREEEKPGYKLVKMRFNIVQIENKKLLVLECPSCGCVYGVPVSAVMGTLKQSSDGQIGVV